MKVKLLKRTAGVTISQAKDGDGISALPGDILDVPDKVARQWIKAGIATDNLKHVIPPAPTDPAMIRAAKRAARKGTPQVARPSVQVSAPETEPATPATPPVSPTGAVPTPSR